MSSQESAASRRNDLFQFLEDQIQNGVYRTVTQSVKQPDPLTGVEKTVSVVQVVTDKQGQIVRGDDSTLREFGVRVFNPVINEIIYAKEVEDQIQGQQRLTMQIQTSIAEAKQAEQKAITAEKNGQAEAAKQKWEQEAIKAKEVTKAEQTLAVATLAAQEAAQYKRKQVLEGEGEAEKRKLLMSSDGALAAKLETYVATQKVWAEAFKGFQGQLVPNIVTGGGGQSGNAALNFQDLMSMKAARDLALEPYPRKREGQ